MNDGKNFDKLITPDSWLFGWNTVMTRKKFFIAFSLIMGALFFLQHYITSAVEKNSSPFYVPHNLLSSVVSMIIGAIISLGGAYVALKFYDGIEANLRDIFVGPRVVAINFIAGLLLLFLVGWPLFIATFIVVIITQYAQSFLFIGFLLYIPAAFYSIVNILKYQFYSYIIIDFDAGPVQALRLSRVIAKNHGFEVFGLDFKIAIMNVLGALCLGIGLLFTIPASFLALAHRYAFLRDLHYDELGIEKSSGLNAAQL